MTIAQQITTRQHQLAGVPVAARGHDWRLASAYLREAELETDKVVQQSLLRQARPVLRDAINYWRG